MLDQRVESFDSSYEFLISLRLIYQVVDQEVVDGTINLLARETGAAGGEVRRVQSGRVQRYALLLFAGVGLFSLALLLVNTT